MTVLSLFDGMSCGRIALERAGIEVDNYYSSEIDKYAIKVADANYPDNIKLGDVTKWREWDLPKIDLLIGGSPCQGFSFAGKQLNFNDPRSSLFFEFVNILNHVKPKYFMLENVKMKKEYQDIISKLLGCEPILINSALVSAQNRNRLYWTNIPNIDQPKDRGITWENICADGSSIAAMRGRYLVKGKRQDGKQKTKGLTSQYIEFRYDGKANALTTVGKDNIVVPFTLSQRVLATEFSYRSITPLECEKLQTVPDNYTKDVSNSQRFKMLGNGWTVDVIAHIFKGLVDQLHI